MGCSLGSHEQRRGGGWGEVDRKREEDEKSRAAFYAGAQIKHRHNSYNNENLYACISVISTVLQNKRDKKREYNSPNSYSPMLTLQTRFRLAGGFCKRTEVQRHKSTPRILLTGLQTYLQIKKPLLGKYFWCWRTVSNTKEDKSPHWSSYMLCVTGYCRFFIF